MLSMIQKSLAAQMGIDSCETEALNESTCEYDYDDELSDCDDFYQCETNRADRDIDEMDMLGMSWRDFY